MMVSGVAPRTQTAAIAGARCLSIRACLGREFVEGVSHLKPADHGSGALRAKHSRIATIIFGARIAPLSRRQQMHADWVPGLHKEFGVANGFRLSDVYGSDWEAEGQMQDAKSYRQYADDCRRIADTMNAKDKAIMLEMAKVWDERADEADANRKGQERAHLRFSLLSAARKCGNSLSFRNYRRGATGNFAAHDI